MFIIILLLLWSLFFVAMSCLINLNLFAQFTRRQIFGMIVVALAGLALSIYCGIDFSLDPQTPRNPKLFVSMLLGGSTVFSIVAGLLMSQIIGNRFYADQFELTRLTNNLDKIKNQKKNIADTLTRDRLNDTAHQSLLNANKLLTDQEKLIEFRIKALEYLIWESRIVKIHQKLLNPDYLRKKVNYKKFSERIKSLIAEVQLQQGYWNKKKINNKSAAQVEISQILASRAGKLVANLDQLLTNLANYEALHTLKDVKQIESSGGDKLLTEGSLTSAIESLHEFTTAPLDRELLFQNLRITSLSELNENS